MDSVNSPPKLFVDTEDDGAHDDFFKYVNTGRGRSNTAYTYNSNPVIVSGGTEIDSDKESSLVVPESPTQFDPLNPNTPEYKMYKRCTTIFFAISLVSAIIVLTLESYIYAVITIHKNSINSPSKFQELAIFLALFIFATIFQNIITIIGLTTKNILLLAFLCAFYACMLIYTGIQFKEINDFVGYVLVGRWSTATRGTNIATICVIALTMVLQGYIIFRHLNKYVGWFKFKKIGGDLQIKRMYQVYQIHRALLIFGFFFFLGFTIQFIIIMVGNKRSTEFILTCCVLPLTIIVLCLSDISVIKEWLWLAIPCCLVYIGGIAYVLFKIIRLYTRYTSAYELTFLPGEYFPGRSSLVTFGIISAVFLVSIVVCEVVLMANFNKGLKPIVQHSRLYRFEYDETKEEEEDQISID